MSNIAWDPADDGEVATILLGAGVDAVEVAPTKAWPDPRAAGVPDAQGERERWADLGLDVVATQALLFGRPDLQLFGADDVRQQMADHLAHVLTLGAAMGASAQVFGSPRNRRREALPAQDALARAVDFFKEVGAGAQAAGTAVVIEGNPEEYGADFLTSAHEAAALVMAVDSPGVRLHLDTACMVLAGDDPVECVHRYASLLAHVHLSSPGLGPVGDRDDPVHASVVEALRDVRYQGTVSVEMRPTSDPVASVRAAARYAGALVGGAS